MQDLASEFSKIFFPGVIPPDSHSGRGHERPGVGTQTLAPLNFSAVVAPAPATLGTYSTPAYLLDGFR